MKHHDPSHRHDHHCPRHGPTHNFIYSAMETTQPAILCQDRQLYEPSTQGITRPPTNDEGPHIGSECWEVDGREVAAEAPCEAPEGEDAFGVEEGEAEEEEEVVEADFVRETAGMEAEKDGDGDEDGEEEIGEKDGGDEGGGGIGGSSEHGSGGWRGHGGRMVEDENGHEPGCLSCSSPINPRRTE